MRAIGRSNCKNQLIAVISHASHPLYDVIRKLTRQRNKSTINETILTINVELRFSFQKFGLFGLHRSLGVCYFVEQKNTEFRTISRSIQLMLVRQCKYLQITHYFHITTENLSEFNFRGILN